jgi:hypothetical protein
MNTKTFAQQSRTILMDGVANKLLYWGFKADGSTSEEPNLIAGGYTFRGKVFDDETVIKLWTSLQEAVKIKGIDVVKEEAAYTWFNRMMALQIMAKNDYLDDQLAYVPGMANTPQILQKGRQGQYAFLNNKEQERLKRIITDFNKEQEAFALLLVGYCHSNKMLNNVFGKLDDYTELLLPDNMLKDTGFLHLLNTTDAITEEQYKEVELIGWLYQFYISERKDEVFKSFKKKKKAEAKDIPAATQIFTPNWIVKYMVQNTVGKIWLDKNPNSKIKSSLNYLVENDPSTELSVGSDSPSEPIISEVSQLTLIDPASGSGHILVEGFDLLYQIYMEEYYTPEEAVESILKNNLFGLDIDDRAAQLATFAILLKAAKQYRDVFAKGWLPNVYAMPEYATFTKQEIKDFLGSEGIAHENELTDALNLMKQAKNLGSVMKLSLSEDSISFIEKRFTALKNSEFRDFNTEIVYQKINSFIPVLLILSKKYIAVVANPPYMGLNNLNQNLINYLEENYWSSRHDLSNVFIKVCNYLTKCKCYFSLINQQSWMFSKSYIQLRINLLENISIKNLAHLGPNAFPEIKGEVVQSVISVIKNISDINNIPIIIRLVDFKDSNLKKENIHNLSYYYNSLSQEDYKSFEEYKFQYGVSKPLTILIKNKLFIKDFFETREGLTTGDNNIFLKYIHEVSKEKIGTKWHLHVKGGDYRKWYGNFDYVVNWENNGQAIKNNKTDTGRVRSHNYNEDYILKEGFTWGSFGSINSFRFVPQGFLFDSSGSMGFNIEEDHEILINTIGYLNSCVVYSVLPYIKGNNNAKPGHISLIPFNNTFDENCYGIVIDSINISKKDWNSRETSWDFEKTQLLNEKASLKLAFKKWLEDATQNFYRLHSNEEELNRIFIKIYGLYDELSPKVSLKDVTLLQDELKKNDLEALEEKFRAHSKDVIELPFNRGEVISQFISYAIGLFMGRYRLDKPGLNIAHPTPTKEELASYTYNHGEIIIDQDAILPIMGKNCNFNDDVVKQFTQLLDTIWGHEQRTENINFIQECLDKELDKFIVNDFWNYHCGMYKKTPIYWLFSSKKGAFQVLVYMHRMNEFTVEKIRANYLLEHLKYLKSEIAQKEANASSLSTAEAKQLDKLRADLIECEQYDMALKNVADQQIKFDLDDGVAKNYELFETVVAKIK